MKIRTGPKFQKGQRVAVKSGRSGPLLFWKPGLVGEIERVFPIIRQATEDRMYKVKIGSLSVHLQESDLDYYEGDLGIGAYLEEEEVGTRGR